MSLSDLTFCNTNQLSCVKEEPTCKSPIKQKLKRLPKCTVCGDRSSGFHYGAYACEGCKGFFRRMVTSSLSIDSVLQCTGTKKYRCEIKVDTRSKCQRCRLQRCFIVGMTRYKTRLGRRTQELIEKQKEREMESLKISSNEECILSDFEMRQLMNKENKIFHTLLNGCLAEAEDNADDVDKVDTPKCVKWKAKFYSEKNSKSYPKYSPQSENMSVAGSSPTCAAKTMKENEGMDSVSYGLGSIDPPATHFSNLSQQSTWSASSINSVINWDDSSNTVCDRPVPNLVSSHSNRKTKCVESVKRISNLLCINELYLQTEHINESEQVAVKNCYRQILQLSDLCHPSMDELEEFFRLKVDKIPTRNSDYCSHIVHDLMQELAQVRQSISAIFKHIPEYKLRMQHNVSQYDKNPDDIIYLQGSTLNRSLMTVFTIWLIRLVNIAENILYNPSLTIKIPRYVLVNQLTNQSYQPHQKMPNEQNVKETISNLRQRYFDMLFEIAADTELVFTTMELDDIEIVYIVSLMITLPDINYNFHNQQQEFHHHSSIKENTMNLLTPNMMYPYRRLYFKAFYQYISQEKFVNAKQRIQKVFWLIMKCHDSLSSFTDLERIFDSTV